MLSAANLSAGAILPLAMEPAGAWCLAAPGAIVHAHTRTAVVADLHLGYEWSRRRRGDALPVHTLDETCRKLERLLAVADVNRLVIAGDAVESRRWCRETQRDLEALRGWLAERGVGLERIKGNHDAGPRGQLPERLMLDGWEICHGDAPAAAERVIVGHHHPALGGDGVMAPCFLVSDSCIVLPALSKNAAGLNLLTNALPRALWGNRFRCIAATDEGLLDFGDLDEARQRATMARR